MYELRNNGLVVTSPINEFESFLLLFQSNWNEIIVSIQAYEILTNDFFDEYSDYVASNEAYKKFQTLYADELKDAIDQDSGNHPIFRCHTSAITMQYLFQSDRPTTLPKITYTVISFDGALAPDHIFILLRGPDNINYILQSYYNAYTFNGIYGLYRLSNYQFHKFVKLIDDFINMYKSIKHRKHIRQKDVLYLARLRFRLSYYTGVNSFLHEPDTYNITEYVSDTGKINTISRKYLPQIHIKEFTSYSQKSFKRNVMKRLTNLLCPIEEYLKHKEDIVITNVNDSYAIYVCNDTILRYLNKENLQNFVGIKNIPFHIDPKKVNINNKEYIVFNISKTIYHPLRWVSKAIDNMELRCKKKSHLMDVDVDQQELEFTIL